MGVYFLLLKTNFQQALPALRLMPELNKLQNQQLEIKGCAARDPIPPAVDLCSKHSSIVHTLSHFLKYVIYTYLSKLPELRVLTLLRRIENDFAHTKIPRNAAKMKSKSSRPVSRNAFHSF